jgi:hypothetical protein
MENITPDYTFTMFTGWCKAFRIVDWGTFEIKLNVLEPGCVLTLATQDLSIDFIPDTSMHLTFSAAK